MTRDSWMRKCAQKLMDEGGLDVGEAAATAEAIACVQQADHGRNPAFWTPPEHAAQAEIAEW